MKIALIGYGKMGKVIEQIALQRGHIIALKIDQNNSNQIEQLLLDNHPDVAIEFSVPTSAVANISTCLKLNIPVAIGTTGWYEEYSKVKELVEVTDGTILAATNFSVGVNIFLEINAKLAALMRMQNQYSVQVEETHHIHKLDAPSGTAITIAEGILSNSGHEDWYLNKGEEKTGIPIFAHRIDEVPGTHNVIYKSEVDAIEIKHEAYNRNGFALGAVLAAEFIYDKKGIFTMKDVLNIN